MQTLEKALANLIKQGEISRAEALAKSSRPNELKQLISND
jgi:twitching motility protein PilT